MAKNENSRAMCTHLRATMWGKHTPTNTENTEKHFGLGTVWLAAESELTTELFAALPEGSCAVIKA